MPTTRAPDVGVDVVTTLSPAVSEEISALLDVIQEVDGYASVSDQALFVIEGGRVAGSVAGTGSVAGVGADDRTAGSPTVSLIARVGATRALGGYALLVHRRGVWDFETAIDPAHRQTSTHGGAGIADALLDAALAEVVARGGGRVQAWVRDGDPRTLTAMASRGLHPGRELLQLRAPLPPETARDASSPPVPVRPFRPGRDEAAWLEVNARSFEDHPEQGAWTLEDLLRREREPWFDPGGFLLHEVEGRIAAFCWTKVHRTPVLGEIYVIGVDPDFQGRGLGRALTRAGLGHLATRGISTAMLYVEASNLPALVLYRSLGFVEHHREVVCIGEVAGMSLASGDGADPAAEAGAPTQVEAPTARPTP